MAGVKAVDPRVSFAEMQQWPDDGRRYELYDGEVIVIPAPLPRHQRVMMHLGDLLAEYEQETGGLVFESPIDIVLSEYDVVQPDLVFFTRERRHLIDMMEATRVPPDLAVEVLSRTTEARDRGQKMQLLAKYGVREYWIVDPVGNRIEVHVLSGAGYVLDASCGAADEVRSPTLQGLTFQAARVFAD